MSAKPTARKQSAHHRLKRLDKRANQILGSVPIDPQVRCIRIVRCGQKQFASMSQSELRQMIGLLQRFRNLSFTRGWENSVDVIIGIAESI